MEQNAGKPLTPEPRLSQVSPFVSLPTLSALVSFPAIAGYQSHLPILSTLS